MAETGNFQPVLTDFVVMVQDAFGNVLGVVATYVFTRTRWAVVEEIAYFLNQSCNAALAANLN